MQKEDRGKVEPASRRGIKEGRGREKRGVIGLSSDLVAQPCNALKCFEKCFAARRLAFLWVALFSNF